MCQILRKKAAEEQILRKSHRQNLLFSSPRLKEITFLFYFTHVNGKHWNTCLFNHIFGNTVGKKRS